MQRTWVKGQRHFYRMTNTRSAAMVRASMPLCVRMPSWSDRCTCEMATWCTIQFQVSLNSRAMHA
eukprot:881068-Amphidinium_carterae.3